MLIHYPDPSNWTESVVGGKWCRKNGRVCGTIFKQLWKFSPPINQHARTFPGQVGAVEKQKATINHAKCTGGKKARRKSKNNL